MCKQVCKKFLHYFAWVAIIGNLLLIGLVAFWLIYPYQVPEIKQPIPIMNSDKEIAVGDNIRMKLAVDKHNDMTPSVVAHNITCTDGNLVTMAAKARTLPKGSYTIDTNNYILPPKVAKGATCQFNYVNTYKLNPIKSVTTTYSSEQFKVKE